MGGPLGMVGGIFDAFHGGGFERLIGIVEFFDAFRGRVFEVRKPLRIA
jgi:hypothetical protein